MFYKVPLNTSVLFWLDDLKDYVSLLSNFQNIFKYGETIFLKWKIKNNESQNWSR